MAFAAAIGPIISGIASIAGAMISASAMRNQADAEEKVARWNADREREKAAREQSLGARESEKVADAFKQKAAEARAIMAQGGLDTTSGTPLLLQQQFAADKFMEENMVMANAKTAQSDRLNKASITEYEGKLRADALRSQATASLLGGAAGAVKGFGKSGGAESMIG